VVERGPQVRPRNADLEQERDDGALLVALCEGQREVLLGTNRVATVGGLAAVSEEGRGVPRVSACVRCRGPGLAGGSAAGEQEGDRADAQPESNRGAGLPP